jgi:hypothetical protein
LGGCHAARSARSVEKRLRALKTGGLVGDGLAVETSVVIKDIVKAFGAI